MRQRSCEHGGILMEYMLLATLIAVVCIVGAMAIGGLNSKPLEDAATGISEEEPDNGGGQDPEADPGDQGGTAQ